MGALDRSIRTFEQKEDRTRYDVRAWLVVNGQLIYYQHPQKYK